MEIKTLFSSPWSYWTNSFYLQKPNVQSDAAGRDQKTGADAAETGTIHGVEVSQGGNLWLDADLFLIYNSDF
jgi:hypothetical protein